MAIYKETKAELDKAIQRVHELKVLLQQQCPHNDIEEKWYVNDDYAFRKRYTVSYHCKCCDTYASYNEESGEKESELYLKLKKKYRKQELKEWHKKH